jgi:predicted SAM-dependent methyltransferase
VRVIIWTVTRKRKINAYLQSNQRKKLHLGASNKSLPGWLNSDLFPTDGDMVYLDVTRRFPINDNTFDYVMAEHMIEHVPYDDAVMMLQECHRVLKPGGRIRIATPDLEVLIGLHSPEKTESQEQYIEWVVNECKLDAANGNDVFVINNNFRAWGHCFLYDRETLKSTMTTAGFVNVTFYKPGISGDPNLEGVESHGKGKGTTEEINQFETFVAEAECQKNVMES